MNLNQRKIRLRFLIPLLFLAIPFVGAEPISPVQETAFTLVKKSPALSLPKHSKTSVTLTSSVRIGTASWYSETDPFINLHTANGEIFDDSKFTCASWDYPFGTLLKVENPVNGKSVVCRVNDRGPAKRLGRMVDLTKAAFREIANPKQGLIEVRMSVTANQDKTSL